MMRMIVQRGLKRRLVAIELGVVGSRGQERLAWSRLHGFIGLLILEPARGGGHPLIPGVI